jgi:ABC-type sugar transport system ATPase subunit
MDEVLSNPDEGLNLHLRKELLHLHSQLGFTLIFVTYDQGEAREIGTRILHMRQGIFERIGTDTNTTPPGVNTVGRNGTE